MKDNFSWLGGICWASENQSGLIAMLKSQYAWKVLITKEMGAVVLTAVLILAGLTVWHHMAIDRIEQDLINEQKEAVLSAKVAQVETLFNTVYQNLRTISSLPSVRSIQGNNRLEKDHENVVTSGRFTHEGELTVQSLYNNLASLVSVSEVYAVLDGLNSQNGQIPFFMYDTVLFGDQPAAEDAGAAKSVDQPDEVETAEYAYFPTQINAAKLRAPRFNFTKFDEIPAFISPLMRTCDNAQYTSIKNGNEKDAFGILYSVPFYAHGGEFRGLISAIIRKNVFEAMLLGIPFVPVTEQDRLAQNKQGWKMPSLGDFVLENHQFGIQIWDRRNTALLQHIAEGKMGRNNFVEQLHVASDAPWQLVFHIPESDFSDATAAQKKLFMGVVIVVVLTMVAALTAMAVLNRIRRQFQSVAEVVHAVSHGDLNVAIPEVVDTYRVMGSMQKMLDSLRSLVSDIKCASDAIHVASNEMVLSNQDLAVCTDEQSANLSKTAASMEQLQGAVKRNANSAKQANTLILSASEVATQGGAMVRKVVDNMDTIHASSKRIADITGVIDGIAFQTNILALNAAVEAARAGEQGRGFAVVASEVRSLAQRSATAAKEIKQLISESVDKVEAGSTLVKEAGDTMHQILSSVERVTAIMSEIVEASSEQSVGIEEVNDAMHQMAHATEQNVARVQQAAGVAQALGNQAEQLVNAVGVFNRGEVTIDAD